MLAAHPLLSRRVVGLLVSLGLVGLIGLSASVAPGDSSQRGFKQGKTVRFSISGSWSDRKVTHETCQFSTGYNPQTGLPILEDRKVTRIRTEEGTFKTTKPGSVQYLAMGVDSTPYFRGSRQGDLRVTVSRKEETSEPCTYPSPLKCKTGVATTLFEPDVSVKGNSLFPRQLKLRPIPHFALRNPNTGQCNTRFPKIFDSSFGDGLGFSATTAGKFAQTRNATFTASDPSLGGLRVTVKTSR